VGPAHPQRRRPQGRQIGGPEVRREIQQLVEGAAGASELLGGGLKQRQLEEGLGVGGVVLGGLGAPARS
jgi:hypothetical protein